MRKAAAILMLTLFPLNLFAAEPSNDDEEMGHIAGVVLACGAYKPLYQFEEILSRYISNTSRSPEIEKARLRSYAQSKLSSFSIYRKRKEECASAVRDFTRMPIFKTELYSDGSLRMPDGKFFYPRGQKKLAANAEKIYPTKRK